MIVRLQELPAYIRKVSGEITGNALWNGRLRLEPFDGEVRIELDNYVTFQVTQTHLFDALVWLAREWLESVESSMVEMADRYSAYKDNALHEVEQWRKGRSR